MKNMGLYQLSRTIMSGIVGKCFLLLMQIFNSNGLLGQTTTLPEVYILDTIKIENAVSVYFGRKKAFGVPVVVEKEQLDILDKKSSRNVQSYFFSVGYLGIDGHRLVSYLERELSEGKWSFKDSVQIRLLCDDTKDYIYRLSKFKPYKGRRIEYKKLCKNIQMAEVPYTSYLFFLVKASKLNEWTDYRNYKFTDVENLYLPAVMRMPWIEDNPE